MKTPYDTPLQSLSLEQFVEQVSPENTIRLALNVHVKDHMLAVNTYAGDQEYPASMTQDEQFLYALLILEAEGR